MLSSPSPSRESFPQVSHLRYTFKEPFSLWRWRTPEILLDWYDGGLIPEEPWRRLISQALPRRFPAEGLLLVGDRGIWLMADGAGKRHFFSTREALKLTPMEDHPLCAAIPFPAKTFSLQRTFLEMVRMRRIQTMPNNVSRAMMETILTGCVAQRHGGTISWSSWRGKFTDAPKANQWVQAPVRKGWELPEDR